MRTMISRELLQSIVRDIREDSFEMERVDHTGQAHGWSARFRAYAEVLEGHMPHASPVPVIEPPALRSTPEDDEELVPVGTQ